MHAPRSWHIIALLCTAVDVAWSQPSPSVVYQFSPPYWVENLAVRPNGNIIPIATLGTSAILQQINPVTNTTEEIYDFSAVGNSIQGITSVSPDVFAVNVMTCNYTELNCTAGSATSWLVEFGPDGHSHEEFTVTELIAWPSEGLQNGLAALDNHTILLADSFLGGIWSLDIQTRIGKLLYTDHSMAPTPESQSGVNGIRIRPGKMYFTNAATATLNSIEIDATGMKIGQASLIAQNLTGPDDFEVDETSGFAYLANGGADQVVRIGLLNGTVEEVASVPGPTSVRWTDGEGSRFYVSTGGGLAQYATHNITRGGAVYEVEIER